MFITFRTGADTNINPGRLTALAGGNDLITVIEHDLLGFGSFVILFHIIFHDNILQ